MMTENEFAVVQQQINDLLVATFGKNMTATKGQIFDMVLSANRQFDNAPEKQVQIMQVIIEMWEMDLL